MREWQLQSQPPEMREALSPALVIRAPTPQEELIRLRYTLLNIPQYEELKFEQGKDYLLPLVTPTFQTLNKPDADLIILEEERVQSLFEDQEYQREFYTPGIQRLELERPHVIEAIRRFQELHQKWEFKLFPQYEIVLTKYGTGGSYNHEIGKATILSGRDGIYGKRHPGEKTIHELLHTGVEEDIVISNQLTHHEKERLVDRIYVVGFLDIIPEHEYRFPNEATEMDKYITRDSLGNLPSAIKQYVEDHPRRKAPTKFLKA